IGCGGGADTGAGDAVGGPNVGTTTAAITQRVSNISGCDGTVAFDVTSPQAIHFIAVQGPNIDSSQLQLFDANENDQLTRVDKDAQTVDSSLASLLSSNSGQSAASKSFNNASNSAAAHAENTTANAASDKVASANANAANAASKDSTL